MRGNGLLSGQRVILVLASLELGGAERQALLLANYLRNEERASVQVWGLKEPGQTAALCDAYHLPWHLHSLEWPPVRSSQIKAILGFANSLRDERPDILLPYTVFPNSLCGVVWRLTGARLCVWNQRDAGLSWTGRHIERWAVRNTPLFISNSRPGADFLTKELGIPQNQVSLVPNGVTLDPPVLDRATWRERLNSDPDVFVACMVANLSQQKDHETLLRAWRKVIDALAGKGRSAMLVLAGRFDSAHTRLKALAYDLELGKSVRFQGPVEDVTGLLLASDLGVFSSRSEGCPNGVLECMAAGLAIVATDVPGIQQVVGPGGQSFLAAPGDADAFADRILDLASNPELREQLGNANARRTEQDYSAERMCRETVAQIYRGLEICG